MTNQQSDVRLEDRVDFLDVIQQTLWDMGIKKRSVEIAQAIMPKVFDISETHIDRERKAFAVSEIRKLAKTEVSPGEFDGGQPISPPLTMWDAYPAEFNQAINVLEG